MKFSDRQTEHKLNHNINRLEMPLGSCEVDSLRLIKYSNAQYLQYLTANVMDYSLIRRVADNYSPQCTIPP
ncbi:MAG: hypothetical protein ACJAZP_003105 [Psychromonas sp.]|jgi:hypothetical protein